jgi:hypothetical protein
MDCGSKAVYTTTNRFGTTLHMEQVNYECGAEFRSLHTRNDNTGRVHQCGCTNAQDCDAA